MRVEAIIRLRFQLDGDAVIFIREGNVHRLVCGVEERAKQAAWPVFTAGDNQEAAHLYPANVGVSTVRYGAPVFL